MLLPPPQAACVSVYPHTWLQDSGSAKVMAAAWSGLVGSGGDCSEVGLGRLGKLVVGGTGNMAEGSVGSSFYHTLWAAPVDTLPSDDPSYLLGGGLGSKGPLLNWGEGGTVKMLDYNWADWVSGQVKRVWDLMDISLLRSAVQLFSPQPIFVRKRDMPTWGGLIGYATWSSTSLALAHLCLQMRGCANASLLFCAPLTHLHQGKGGFEYALTCINITPMPIDFRSDNANGPVTMGADGAEVYSGRVTVTSHLS
ncbi:hypothetical protein EI94DRAFT_1704741 [Lactarius quietus]|nr:hypothetical protein EI94DRAFT_1704741 [Lactarius quietus]